MATITDDGLEYQARYVNQSTSGSWTVLAIGSGSTAEATTDTALATEITANGGARAAATCTYEATAKSVWYHLWTFTGNVTVREAAVTNSVTVAGSKILMRHVWAADKSFVNGETFALTAKLTQSR